MSTPSHSFLPKKFVASLCRHFLLKNRLCRRLLPKNYRRFLPKTPLSPPSAQKPSPLPAQKRRRKPLSPLPAQKPPLSPPSAQKPSPLSARPKTSSQAFVTTSSNFFLSHPFLLTQDVLINLFCRFRFNCSRSSNCELYGCVGVGVGVYLCV